MNVFPALSKRPEKEQRGWLARCYEQLFGRFPGFLSSLLHHISLFHHRSDQAVVSAYCMHTLPGLVHRTAQDSEASSSFGELCGKVSSPRLPDRKMLKLAFKRRAVLTGGRERERALTSLASRSSYSESHHFCFPGEALRPGKLSKCVTPHSCHRPGL